jgi:hypothetical protein
MPLNMPATNLDTKSGIKLFNSTFTPNESDPSTAGLAFIAIGFVVTAAYGGVFHCTHTVFPVGTAHFFTAACNN